MNPTEYHAEFLEALPRIVAHADISFRFVVCRERRADYVAETIALTWKSWLRLRSKGEKDPREFVTAIAGYAVRAVRSGRRVCGVERAKDAMSPVAQRQGGFRMERLEGCTRQSQALLYSEPRGQRTIDAFEERLRDNTMTPPPDQAAFRIDYPHWRATYDERKRRIIDAMVEGESTLGLSEQFSLSPSRISQMRRQFLESWHGYTEGLHG